MVVWHLGALSHQPAHTVNAASKPSEADITPDLDLAYRGGTRNGLPCNVHAPRLLRNTTAPSGHGHFQRPHGWARVRSIIRSFVDSRNNTSRRGWGTRSHEGEQNEATQGGRASGWVGGHGESAVSFGFHHCNVPLTLCR